jgi:bifunctional DNA-binding transcriptional regulator/antitoxin component of YhaV-PrlF toxin-antitoxin module
MPATKLHAEVRLGPQGRLVIPSHLRKALGFHPGDALIARVERNRLVIQTREALLDEIQGMFRHVKREGSVVDELIRERREEAHHEEEEWDRYEAERRAPRQPSE